MIYSRSENCLLDASMKGVKAQIYDTSVVISGRKIVLPIYPVLELPIGKYVKSACQREQQFEGDQTAKLIKREAKQ